MTPRELFLILDDHNERERRRREDMLTGAYLTAYWQRVTRLPSLKQILEDNKPISKEEQSPEQMFAAVKRIHAQFEK